LEFADGVDVCNGVFLSAEDYAYREWFSEYAGGVDEELLGFWDWRFGCQSNVYDQLKEMTLK